MHSEFINRVNTVPKCEWTIQWEESIYAKYEIIYITVSENSDPGVKPRYPVLVLEVEGSKS